MGLDLITQRNCDVKQKVPQNELLNLIKERNRATQVLKMVINSGKSKEEAFETEFTQRLQTQDGVKDLTVKVSSLFEKTAILDELGGICKDCIISQNKPFGCIGSVSYPISLKCEEWLATMAFEANKKGKPFSMSIEFILDQKINGQRIKEMRAQEQTFFESNKPVDIILSKSLFSKKKIDTNQLFDITFLQGLMQTTHINYLLMMFGNIVTDNNKPESKPYKYDDENKKYVFLDLNLPKDYDKSILEFHNYFHHLFLAVINGNDVLMD